MPIKKKSLSEIPIKSLPYEVRLMNYEREKTELFAKNFGIPASEMAEMHKKLAEKWRV